MKKLPHKIKEFFLNLFLVLLVCNLKAFKILLICFAIFSIFSIILTIFLVDKYPQLFK